MRLVYAECHTYTAANDNRKYELNKTFGIVTSATSNSLWIADEDASKKNSRSSGAGSAVVGADDEVLCWDIKKGEVLSRWRAHENAAQITTIARSSVDPDVYAVGLASKIWSLTIRITDCGNLDMKMAALDFGTID